MAIAMVFTRWLSWKIQDRARGKFQLVKSRQKDAVKIVNGKKDPVQNSLLQKWFYCQS